MPEFVASFKELKVYQRALEASLRIYDITDKFPPEERYRLSTQIIKSSGSVAAQITEAWRRRRNRGAFIDKLNISEGEAAETQHWITVAYRRGYVDQGIAGALDEEYEHIMAQLVTMIHQVDRWTLPKV